MKYATIAVLKDGSIKTVKYNLLADALRGAGSYWAHTDDKDAFESFDLVEYENEQLFAESFEYDNILINYKRG